MRKNSCDKYYCGCNFCQRMAFCESIIGLLFRNREDINNILDMTMYMNQTEYVLFVEWLIGDIND